jgi:hypothetical protein
MTTREAARPLRRYMRARVRAASLAPTYTITRDVTLTEAPADPSGHAAVTRGWPGDEQGARRVHTRAAPW